MSFLNLLTGIAQGAADSLALRSTQKSAKKNGGPAEPGCSPCKANAYVAGLYGAGQPAKRAPARKKK